ncbi:MAG TPA: hypothetical protein VFW98_03535, partial [Gemmatimonadaceae bacterium]|nr:hypothetical protein [Gemmatimonadaceae bacterium]
NVIIYNWSGQGTVTADVRGALRVGEHYAVRNAEDFYGAPVATGTYEGGTLSLPVVSVRPPVPVGGRAEHTPPTTGPIFNVYIIVPVDQ